MWDKIKILSSQSYRSDPHNPKCKTKDKMRVTLDMPTECFSNFRKQIEISHVRNRRKSDESS